MQELMSGKKAGSPPSKGLSDDEMQALMRQDGNVRMGGRTVSDKMPPTYGEVLFSQSSTAAEGLQNRF
jgi:hypothetical protein